VLVELIEMPPMVANCFRAVANAAGMVSGLAPGCWLDWTVGNRFAGRSLTGSARSRQSEDHDRQLDERRDRTFDEQPKGSLVLLALARWRLHEIHRVRLICPSMTTALPAEAVAMTASAPSVLVTVTGRTSTVLSPLTT
jgi:hypothetical protein